MVISSNIPRWIVIAKRRYGIENYKLIIIDRGRTLIVRAEAVTDFYLALSGSV